MKDYSAFNAVDFARDERFLKWVKYPDLYPELDGFWQEWLRHNSHKSEEIEQARQFVFAILNEKFVATDGQQQEIWNRITATVSENVPEKRKSKQVRLWRSVLSRAAVVIMVLGVGFLSWKYKQASGVVNNTIAERAQGLHIETNSGNTPKTLLLADGTSVVLQPHSKIEYPLNFSTDSTREVRLIGEAFFEVKKDATRPFLVFTNEIVTRVLGTSFIIRNYENENIRVQVKTGRVSVFKTSYETKGEHEVTRKDAVVLTPNQQVEYERKEEKLTKSLVENPDLLHPVAKIEFEFTDTPVSDVFQLIEGAYGVKIVYDKEVMANCSLNASLSDVSLNEKLKLICMGIKAQYEIIDSQIVIYSEGCE